MHGAPNGKRSTRKSYRCAGRAGMTAPWLSRRRHYESPSERTQQPHRRAEPQQPRTAVQESRSVRSRRTVVPARVGHQGKGPRPRPSIAGPESEQPRGPLRCPGPVCQGPVAVQTRANDQGKSPRPQSPFRSHEPEQSGGPLPHAGPVRAGRAAFQAWCGRRNWARSPTFMSRPPPDSSSSSASRFLTWSCPS